MSASQKPDAAERLVAELNGACGPHVLAGINGNIPAGWSASNLKAYRREPAPSQRISVFCNGDQTGQPFADGIGGKIEVEAGTPEAEHLKIADALAASLRAALAAWAFVDGRADDPTRRVRVALLDGGMLPERKTAGASGYDLRARESVQIQPGRVSKIGTGVYLELAAGTEAQIRPRSGLALRGMWVHWATIDSDYRGECVVIAANVGTEPLQVNAGDRIAQLVFGRVDLPELEIVPIGNLSATARGAGGFGSTGF